MRPKLIRIARDGKTIGEYTLADLGRAIKAKTVLATDYYWRSGMTGWERVELIVKEALGALCIAESMPQHEPNPGLLSSLSAKIGVSPTQIIALAITAIAVAAVIGYLSMARDSTTQPSAHAARAIQIPIHPAENYTDAEEAFRKGKSEEHGRYGHDKAFEYIKKAAGLGHAKAEVWLGEHYMVFSTPKYPEESRKLFLSAVEKKETSAYFWLGQLYIDNGVPFKDYAEACKWYNLGVMLGEESIRDSCKGMLANFRSDPAEWGVSEEQQSEGVRRAGEYLLQLKRPKNPDTVSSVSSVAPAKVAAEIFSGKASTPLRSEFYQDKYGKIYFKVWIEKESDIPYDEFTWKITKVAAPDGKRFSNSYPTSRSLLLKGQFMNSHAWGGVNPYGSDCQSGDRFIIEIPRFAPLSIDVPDTSKGLKVLPYSH